MINSYQRRKSSIDWLRYHDAQITLYEMTIASYAGCSGPKVERDLANLRRELELVREIRAAIWRRLNGRRAKLRKAEPA